MADNYATNQFYNFATYESGVFTGGEAQTVNATDNPPFIYPPKTLRNSVNGVSTPIQRGYLRMMGELIDEKDKTVARRRLHFQFNPDSITRQVTARNDIQLWMNMDPSQMTQPIPGDANFAFELLFNREAEVSSGKFSNGSGALNTPTSRSSRAAALVGVPTEEVSQFSQTSVPEIGVLADLIVFDEIIGQGLNKDLLNTLVNRAELGSEYTAAQEAQENLDSTSDEEDKTPKQQNTAKFDRAQVEQALRANWGNSAFLISQPIRVVFSSLFMVEGYVTSTQVTFNKFTPTMVPVQAVVGIQMQAMYIGFAKKDTFFTKTFKSNEEEYAKAVAERTAEEKALAVVGDKLFSNLDGLINDNHKLAVSTILGVKDGGTKRGDFRVRYSDELRAQIKKGSVSKIEAFGSLVVTYKGNSGTPTPGHTFSMDEEVYSAEVSGWSNNNTDLTLRLTDNKNSDIPVSFDWPKLPLPAQESADTSSTSKYNIKVRVTFSITSNTGTTVQAAHEIVLDTTEKWSEEIYLYKVASLSVNPDTSKNRTEGL